MNKYGKYERLVNQLISGQSGASQVHQRAVPTCGLVRRCQPVRFVQRLETIWEEAPVSVPHTRTGRRHT